VTWAVTPAFYARGGGLICPAPRLVSPTALRDGPATPKHTELGREGGCSVSSAIGLASTVPNAWRYSRHPFRACSPNTISPIGVGCFRT